MYVFPPQPELPFTRQAAADAHTVEVGYAHRQYNSRIRVPVYGPEVCQFDLDAFALLYFSPNMPSNGRVSNSAIALLTLPPQAQGPHVRYLTTPHCKDRRHTPIFRQALDFAQGRKLATWDAEALIRQLEHCIDARVVEAFQQQPLFCIRSSLEALGIDAQTPTAACFRLQMDPPAAENHLAITLVLRDLLHRACHPELFPEQFPHLA